MARLAFQRIERFAEDDLAYFLVLHRAGRPAGRRGGSRKSRSYAGSMIFGTTMAASPRRHCGTKKFVFCAPVVYNAALA
jgi:hypothetical protein